MRIAALLAMLVVALHSGFSRGRALPPSLTEEAATSMQAMSRQHIGRGGSGNHDPGEEREGSLGDDFVDGRGNSSPVLKKPSPDTSGGGRAKSHREQRPMLPRLNHRAPIHHPQPRKADAAGDHGNKKGGAAYGAEPPSPQPKAEGTNTKQQQQQKRQISVPPPATATPGAGSAAAAAANDKDANNGNKNRSVGKSDNPQSDRDGAATIPPASAAAGSGLPEWLPYAGLGVLTAAGGVAYHNLRAEIRRLQAAAKLGPPADAAQHGQQVRLAWERTLLLEAAARKREQADRQRRLRAGEPLEPRSYEVQGHWLPPSLTQHAQLMDCVVESLGLDIVRCFRLLRSLLCVLRACGRGPTSSFVSRLLLPSRHPFRPGWFLGPSAFSRYIYQTYHHTSSARPAPHESNKTGQQHGGSGYTTINRSLTSSGLEYVAVPPPRQARRHVQHRRARLRRSQRHLA
jgi:hypothetical protein